MAQPVRWVPFGAREKVERKLDELLESGIIEVVPDTGPKLWNSLSIDVKKIKPFSSFHQHIKSD